MVTIVDFGAFLVCWGRKRFQLLRDLRGPATRFIDALLNLGSGESTHID